MNTNELRNLVKFLPSLVDLVPYLLDERELMDNPDRDKIEFKVLASWDDLSSIHSVITALLKNRPLPF